MKQNSFTFADRLWKTGALKPQSSVKSPGQFASSFCEVTLHMHVTRMLMV